jgi:hypothetical protein
MPALQNSERRTDRQTDKWKEGHAKTNRRFSRLCQHAQKLKRNVLMFRITVHRYLHLKIWPRELFHSKTLNSHFLLYNYIYSSLSEFLRHCLFSVHLNTLVFSHMCSIANTDNLQGAEYSLRKYFLKFSALCES